MNKSKTPVEVKSQDGGSKTLERYRYQITYAAIKSLSLLEDKTEIISPPTLEVLGPETVTPLSRERCSGTFLSNPSTLAAQPRVPLAP